MDAVIAFGARSNVAGFKVALYSIRHCPRSSILKDESEMRTGYRNWHLLVGSPPGCHCAFPLAQFQIVLMLDMPLVPE